MCAFPCPIDHRRLPLRCPPESARSGSLLLEAIIGVGVFAIFLGGIGFSLILGERSTVAGGDRTRAVFLAEQQLEAVRAMRARSFSSLTLGTHGIALTSTGWTFSGASAGENGYRMNVDIVSRGTDWVEVTSNVSWSFDLPRSGSVALTTYLTNWRKVATIGNWGATERIAELTDSGTPEYQNIAVSGNFAYVTSSNTIGGKGLYVFDITNPAAPVRVAGSFDLGASAYGLAVSGERLYLATDNPSSEVQVYDISSPSSLAAGNLVNSYDLPGNGKARSIAVYGNTVFVGTLDDPPSNQFYALQMSETGPMSLLGSLAMSGSVLGISLQDGYAYTATSANAGEFLVVDIFDPQHLTFAPGVGMDLPDVQDGTAILTSGTAALIGRMNGSTIDELIMYSVADAPVPTPPPGPWTLEVGGDVLSLAGTYGRYAFVAGTLDAAQLRVIDTVKLERNEAPILKTYNAGAAVNGIFYDWQHDRLYGVTPSSLLVFAPG